MLARVRAAALLLLVAVAAACARGTDPHRVVDNLLATRGSRFFDALQALARARGWDPVEATRYDSGEGSSHGRAVGTLDDGRARRLGAEILVTLRSRAVAVPGVSALKLLLLDADGRLLDSVSCGLDSRYGDADADVLGAPAADGAKIVVRFHPRQGGHWHNWHVLTVGGRAYTFREREKALPTKWNAKGLCRLAVRAGKLAVVFPDLNEAGR